MKGLPGKQGSPREDWGQRTVAGAFRAERLPHESRGLDPSRVMIKGRGIAYLVNSVSNARALVTEAQGGFQKKEVNFKRYFERVVGRRWGCKSDPQSYSLEEPQCCRG